MPYLKPSEIYFSQDSICPKFDRRSNHSYKTIGETLDDLLTGRCNVNDIPRITVMQKNGKWFSVDNRRLWVFKKLETFGRCSEIPVNMTMYNFSVYGRKFTTYNDGVFIRVRDSGPGGRVWRTFTPDSSARATNDGTWQQPQYHEQSATPRLYNSSRLPFRTSAPVNPGRDFPSIFSRREFLFGGGQTFRTSSTAYSRGSDRDTVQEYIWSQTI